METRKKIIKTALKQFCINGYKNVSLTEIAREVGLAKPSLYHHFSSKKALFAEALNSFFALWEQWLPFYFDSDTDLKTTLKSMFTSFDRLEDELKTLLDTREKMPFGPYYLIFEAIRNFPQYIEIFKTNNRKLMEAFQQKVSLAIKKGEIKEQVDFLAIYYSAGSILEGLRLIQIMDDSFDANDAGNRCFEMIWNSIKA